eukprot:2041104-Amphidinium_carterae.1
MAWLPFRFSGLLFTVTSLALTPPFTEGLLDVRLEPVNIHREHQKGLISRFTNRLHQVALKVVRTICNNLC